jgi:hypothetical protein
MGREQGEEVVAILEVKGVGLAATMGASWPRAA